MAATSLVIATYRYAHGRKPRGYGLWFLQNTRTGQVLQMYGTLTTCRARLPRGDWAVMP
jgi:hypothetical protein